MGKDALISPAMRRKDPPMTDSRVCKSFLLGTCPHDLFVGTKQDIGKCPRLHLEKHKLEYEFRTKNGEKFPEIEHEYFRDLQTYIHDIDRTIEAALRRLEHTPEEKAKIAAVTKDLDILDTKIGLVAQEIDCLAEARKNVRLILQSQQLQKLCEERDKLAENARAVVENVGQSSQQKLQVCEQCGAYLSRLDNDRRLADHFVGKIHLGYVQMRGAYAELNAKLR